MDHKRRAGGQAVTDGQAVADDQRVARPADHWLSVAENVLYAGAGILLLAAAAAVLAGVIYHLLRDSLSGVDKAVTAALNGMLLVFILLELLAGVRATMTERKLVAEPFLIVGIIASIKEIVVVTLQSEQSRGETSGAFEDAMTEIGVLGGVVLLLALATFLVRRKEREPRE